MNSFATRQPRFLVLVTSLAVSTVLFSAIASTFRHVGGSALCVQRMARVEQTQANTQVSASAAAPSGTSSGMKINAKL